MTEITEIAMTKKDYFEVAYWFISLFILAFTIYYIKTSPIKAVKTGRKLNDEQNKYNAKKDLFLTLFSLRGNPTHYDFVNALNQIDIVFQDEPSVLQTWGRLYDSLNHQNLTNAVETWALLRTDLLSEMAKSLGYKALKQTDIQKNYSPQAHADQNVENWNYQQAARSYFETGTEMHNIWIDNFSSQQLQDDNGKLDQ